MSIKIYGSYIRHLSNFLVLDVKFSVGRPNLVWFAYTRKVGELNSVRACAQNLFRNFHRSRTSTRWESCIKLSICLFLKPYFFGCIYSRITELINNWNCFWNLFLQRSMRDHRALYPNLPPTLISAIDVRCCMKRVSHTWSCSKWPVRTDALIQN